MNSSAPNEPYRVLFVCLGNICRSPTAEGIFRDLVREAGLHDRVHIDSAGTGSWHIGAPPDRRTQSAALNRGLDLSGLRARQVSPSDFHEFDLIVAMDRDNHANLNAIRPDESHRAGKVVMMLDFSRLAEKQRVRDVPDPYSDGPDGFETVLDLIDDACRGLLEHIRERLNGDVR